MKMKNITGEDLFFLKKNIDIYSIANLTEKDIIKIKSHSDCNPCEYTHDIYNDIDLFVFSKPNLPEVEKGVGLIVPEYIAKLYGGERNDLFYANTESCIIMDDIIIYASMCKAI